MTELYVIVRRDFEVPTEAHYAYSLEEAQQRRADLMKETETDWRIFKEVYQ